jgi:ABC-type transporter Mla subunit MlaD
MTKMKTPHRDEMEARFATMKAALEDVQEAAGQAVREHRHQLDRLLAERKATLAGLAELGFASDTLADAVDQVRAELALLRRWRDASSATIDADLPRTERVVVEGVGDTEAFGGEDAPHAGGAE